MKMILRAILFMTLTQGVFHGSWPAVAHPSSSVVYIGRTDHINKENKNTSGTIVDKGRGLVLTTCEKPDVACPSSYKILLGNDLHVSANVVYIDPKFGYCILQVDPTKIAHLTAAQISPGPIDIGGTAFVQGFSEKNYEESERDLDSMPSLMGPQSGTVTTSLKMKTSAIGSEIELALPFYGQGNFKGASLRRGPDGPITGLLNGDWGFKAIQPHNLFRVVDALKQGKTPPLSYTIGVSLASVSQSKLKNYLPTPETPQESSTLKTLVVHSVIENGPAENILIAGDMIKSVNGLEILGSDTLFHQAIDDSLGKEIEITLYRNKELKTFKLTPHVFKTLQNLTFIQWEGLVCSENSDTEFMNGQKGGVCCVTRNETSPFRKFFAEPMHLLEIDGITIEKLHDLKPVIEKIAQNPENSVRIKYKKPGNSREYLGFISGFTPKFDHPLRYNFNPQTNTWDAEKIIPGCPS